jgi:hypothetical protein
VSERVARTHAGPISISSHRQQRAARSLCLPLLVRRKKKKSAQPTPLVLRTRIVPVENVKKRQLCARRAARQNLLRERDYFYKLPREIKAIHKNPCEFLY